GCPAAPGGESFDSAARRAARVLAGLPARRTLLISHGYFLKILLATCVDGGRAEDVRAEHLPNGVPILLTAHPVRGWRRSEPPAAKWQSLPCARPPSLITRPPAGVHRSPARARIHGLQQLAGRRIGAGRQRGGVPHVLHHALPHPDRGARPGRWQPGGAPAG